MLEREKGESRKEKEECMYLGMKPPVIDHHINRVALLSLDQCVKIWIFSHPPFLSSSNSVFGNHRYDPIHNQSIPHCLPRAYSERTCLARSRTTPINKPRMAPRRTASRSYQ